MLSSAFPALPEVRRSWLGTAVVGIGNEIANGLRFGWDERRQITLELTMCVPLFIGVDIDWHPMVLVPLGLMLVAGVGYSLAIGRFLPTTHPITAARSVLFDGQGLTLTGDGGLVWMVAPAPAVSAATAPSCTAEPADPEP